MKSVFHWLGWKVLVFLALASLFPLAGAVLSGAALTAGIWTFAFALLAIFAWKWAS